MSVNLESLNAFVFPKQGDLTVQELPKTHRFTADVGIVLVVDQTLGHSGWAKMIINEQGVKVIETGDIKQTGGKGFQGNFDKIDVIFDTIYNLCYHQNVQMILHEMPSVAGRRIDSSNSAAVAVRCAAKSVGLTANMLNARHVKLVLTDNANASKAEVKAKVLELCPEAASMRPLNTNVTDPIALGLVYAMEN
jgi:Holliday junction resolvasome RuvABC endonuclease subunit